MVQRLNVHLEQITEMLTMIEMRPNHLRSVEGRMEECCVCLQSVRCVGQCNATCFSVSIIHIARKSENSPFPHGSQAAAAF